MAVKKKKKKRRRKKKVRKPKGNPAMELVR
jgi:hypothetical protein